MKFFLTKVEGNEILFTHVYIKLCMFLVESDVGHVFSFHR